MVWGALKRVTSIWGFAAIHSIPQQQRQHDSSRLRLADSMFPPRRHSRSTATPTAASPAVARLMEVVQFVGAAGSSSGTAAASSTGGSSRQRRAQGKGAGAGSRGGACAGPDLGAAPEWRDVSGPQHTQICACWAPCAWPRGGTPTDCTLHRRHCAGAGGLRMGRALPGHAHASCGDHQATVQPVLQPFLQHTVCHQDATGAAVLAPCCHLPWALFVPACSELCARPLGNSVAPSLIVLVHIGQGSALLQPAKLPPLCFCRCSATSNPREAA